MSWDDAVIFAIGFVSGGCATYVVDRMIGGMKYVYGDASLSRPQRQAMPKVAPYRGLGHQRVVGSSGRGAWRSDERREEVKQDPRWNEDKAGGGRRLYPEGSPGGGAGGCVYISGPDILLSGGKQGESGGAEVQRDLGGVGVPGKDAGS